jgi:heat shock protein HtpX
LKSFYEEMASNKRLSWLLIVAMAGLMLVTGYVIGLATGAGWSGLIIAGIVAVIVTLVSYYQGVDIIMAASGARQIQKRDAPQLFNVVEEMAIASGNPMPVVYVINDTAPNAFATGRAPQHSAVAVTTGLLDKLNRNELQGVIAHEMSHIRNFDIRYAMLMGVMVGSIALLCDMFLRMSFYGGLGRGRSRDDRRGGNPIIMILAIALAILAPIFATIVQLAMSRRREYLADASAVELTRYPDGLADALQKIASDQEVLEAANRATQHMYIVNPIKSFEARASSMLSTHPPIQDRIRRLREMAGQYPPRE